MEQGCPICYGTGRILFAGDVAGFLNPMGEGISSALESGHLVASSILEHYEDPDEMLRGYQSSARMLMGYMKRQWHAIAGYSSKFSRFS